MSNMLGNNFIDFLEHTAYINLTFSVETGGIMSDKKTRVQIYLRSLDIAILDKVKKQADLPTRAAAMRFALQLHYWWVREQLEGNEIIIRKANGETMVIIDPFIRMKKTEEGE